MRALTKAEVDLIAGASHGNGSAATVTAPRSTGWTFLWSHGGGGGGSGYGGGGGGSGPPPPLVSSDFHLVDPSPQDLAAFQTAIDYLQNSPKGKAILADAAQRGINIHFVTDYHQQHGDPGDTNVYWDPHDALKLSDGSLQSAALGLIHELIHVLYGSMDAYLQTRQDAWDNQEEYNDINNYENPVAVELGEPEAHDHRGGPQQDNDVTDHHPPQ